MPITITEKFYPKTRAQWRQWLTKNHAKKSEIWVIYYKKQTGKPTLAYQDAVDEALCFGWIDGWEKRIDDERYTQRFTPRTKRSGWSESNIKRYQMLVRQGLMIEAGKSAFARKVRAYSPKMLPGGQKWHEKHKMPTNPTLEQRIVWHKEHQKFCGCRPVPKSLEMYLIKQSA